MSILPAGMSVHCWCSFRGQRRAKEILLELELHRVTSHHVVCREPAPALLLRILILRVVVLFSNMGSFLENEQTAFDIKYTNLDPIKLKEKKIAMNEKLYFKATGKKRMIVDHNYQHEEV